MIAFEQVLVIRFRGQEKCVLWGVKRSWSSVSGVCVRQTNYIHLLPSGKRGLILGLILGLSAGDTMAEPLVLTLPRFLLLRAPLASFLSFNKAAGVLAVMGENAVAGLADADAGRAEAGVLEGPSFGVLRAARRGVCSAEGVAATSVLIWAKDGGRRGASLFAAAGSSRSSSPPVSPLLELVLLAVCGKLFVDSRDFGVAALPEGVAVPCCALIAGDCVVEPGFGGGPMTDSVNGSGETLSVPELSIAGGILSPAEPGAILPERWPSRIMVSASLGVVMFESVTDFRFCAF